MTSPSPTQPPAGPAAAPDPEGWTSIALYAGGADLLDGALTQVAGPAITEAEPSSWFFERYTDGHGVHLRIHARAGEKTSDAGLAERMGELLEDLRAEPGPEPLLPRPPSQRGSGGSRGVALAGLPLGRPGLWDAAGLERAAPLFQVSSKLAIDAARDLDSPVDRAACALLACALLSDLGLGPSMRVPLWEEVAAGWTGEGDQAARLREGFEAAAQRLAPDLLAAARELRRGERGGDLEQFEEAAAHLFDETEEREAPALVMLHAHLTCNRLGLNPLEEVLLALLLADGAAERLGGLDDDGAPADQAPDHEGEGEALRFRSVAKRHDDEAALTGVSFDVHEGEVFGLLGPDGAGKSSVLGMAAGLRLPSSGSVQTLGHDPLDERDALVDRVVMVGPDNEVAELATVRENLELRARSHGHGEVSPDEILAATGLTARAATQVDDLEPGERRLVAIGCALIAAPRLLLVDQPAAGLSPVAREGVWELLRAQPEAGRTVVVATASLQEARVLCDRVAVVVGGTVLAVEPPDAIAERFPERKLVFDTEEEPDRALLDDLPEATSVSIEQNADHWTLEIETHQPEELIKLIKTDPAFPAPINRRDLADEGGFPEPGAW